MVNLGKLATMSKRELLHMNSLSIKELEKKTSELWNESDLIEDKNQKLIREIIIEEEMMTEAPWDLDIRPSGVISLISSMDCHKKLFEFLEKWESWRIYPHGSFDLNDKISLACSDGDLYIVGKDDVTAEEIISFIKEWNIDVKFGKEDKNLVALKKRVDNITKVLAHLV